MRLNCLLVFGAFVFASPVLSLADRIEDFSGMNGTLKRCAIPAIGEYEIASAQGSSCSLNGVKFPCPAVKISLVTGGDGSIFVQEISSDGKASTIEMTERSVFSDRNEMQESTGYGPALGNCDAVFWKHEIFQASSSISDKTLVEEVLGFTFLNGSLQSYERTYTSSRQGSLVSGPQSQKIDYYFPVTKTN